MKSNLWYKTDHRILAVRQQHRESRQIHGGTTIDNGPTDSNLQFPVIVPAFNEEACLAATLDSINAAAELLTARSNADVETIVVDNNSVDGTAAIARSGGASVFSEQVQGISRARNTGARHASGDVFVFIDADVNIPLDLLHTIHVAMGDPKCIGGGVDLDYRPRTPRGSALSWRLAALWTRHRDGSRGCAILS